jgi:hypothetical protein
MLDALGFLSGNYLVMVFVHFPLVRHFLTDLHYISKFQVLQTSLWPAISVNLIHAVLHSRKIPNFDVSKLIFCV